MLLLLIRAKSGAAYREALRAYASTIDEDLRLLGDKAEVAPGSVEQMAILVSAALTSAVLL